MTFAKKTPKMLEYEPLGTSGCRWGACPHCIFLWGVSVAPHPFLLSLQGAELRSGDIKGRVLSGECGPHEDAGTQWGGHEGLPLGAA